LNFQATIICPIDLLHFIARFINQSKHVGGIFIYRHIGKKILITKVYRMKGLVESRKKVTILKFSDISANSNVKISYEDGLELARILESIVTQNRRSTSHSYWHTHPGSVFPSDTDLKEKFHIIGGYKKVFHINLKTIIIIYDSHFKFKTYSATLESRKFSRHERYYTTITLPFQNITLNKMFLILLESISKIKSLIKPSYLNHRP